MARSVRPRTAAKESSYAEDNDSEGDTDVEDTPKPSKRSHPKRRFSDIQVDKDPSFIDDGGRMPLKSVNLNDDAAEKRRRRKSAKVVSQENAEAGPSSEGGDGVVAPAAPGFRRKEIQLASVAPTPIINVPFDVMSSNFEEWMKMATDNKINAANSWNFALIDYFHDMSLLRNDSDNSINFQRASCTLDGCVKIWTSRVDSVGTETGRLLSNLADESNNLNDDEAGSDNPDGEPAQTKRTRTHRQESTLAKNAAQLRSKKLDLEFSVDPLFKKTCADFDEGGANGLLMNHLSLGVGSDGALRVIFDASDPMIKDGEEDEDEPLLEPEDQVDLSELRAQFIPNFDDLDNKAITHSLHGFSFSKGSFSFESSLYHDDTTVDYDDDDNEVGGDGFTPMVVDGGAGDPGPAQDFFTGDQAVQDDFGGGDDFGSPDTEMGSAGDESGQLNGGATQSGPFAPLDPARPPNERDLILAMTDADADGGMMNYFDQNFLKNWAGPEHWKLRRAVKRTENTEPTMKKREKKEAFKIDFFTPSETTIKEFASEKFAPATKGAGINLPGHAPSTSKTSASKRSGSKKGKEKVDQVLPDDMHFSSRQLVTLYLKPKFSLKMRGQRVPGKGDGDGEIDENFWAQAAANQAAGLVDGDETADGGAIPFNTQFFHDDYDDGPGFDDNDIDDPSTGAGIIAEQEEQDLLAAVNGNTSRRVRPQFVNYAKKAKRVDVRKLKDNIWKGLKIVTPQKNTDSMDTDEQQSPRAPTDPSDARTFDSVVSNLRRSYPKEKMDDISTSFCFICLLHLANERGLSIEVGESGGDAEEGDNVVGDIWGLKVSRDPNVTIEE